VEWARAHGVYLPTHPSFHVQDIFMMARQATLPPPHRPVVTPIFISNKGIWI
jgi:hypothetical protein